MEGLYMKAGVHTMRRFQPFLDGILHIYPVADKSCYGMITQQKYFVLIRKFTNTVLAMILKQYYFYLNSLLVCIRIVFCVAIPEKEVHRGVANAP